MRQGLYTLGFDLNLKLDWGRVAPIAQRETNPNPMANSYRTADDRYLWLVGVTSDRHWPPPAERSESTISSTMRGLTARGLGLNTGRNSSGCLMRYSQRSRSNSARLRSLTNLMCFGSGEQH